MACLRVNDLKLWLARMYCGKDNARCIEDCLEDRKLVVAFLKDNYGRYSTIVLSLAGSPPKAQAFLFPASAVGWNPEHMEIPVVPISVVVLYSLGHIRHKYAINDPWKLDLSEFFEREDCVVMNNPFTRISSQPKEGT